VTGTRIGLEVHVPLATEAKLYCACPAGEPATANTHLCPTCAGQPGARPRGVNRRAVEHAVTAARVLGCRLEDDTVVQRKHYVYPDLPNNYQRTTTPVGREGRFWDVPIREVHLEEDPGALDPARGTVTLDRSGRPLVEIVTAPALKAPEQVDEWLDVLGLALDRAGVARPGAELKADVNVSTAGEDRVEVKNVVGGSNAEQAAAHEVRRQTRRRERGETVPRETRGFDEHDGTTHALRDKETVGDYRYMPDPDLPPVDLAPAAEAAPEPEDVPARLERLMDGVGLEPGEAIALLEDPRLEALFERVASRVPDERAVDIVLHRLRGELDYREITLSGLDVDPDPIVRLADAWTDGDITKPVFTRLLRGHLDGEDVEAELEQEAEASVDLGDAVAQAIEAHPDAVEDYERGEEAAVNFLVGQVLQATDGRADPKEAREALLERLDG
jgi:aspartyl-tRNA(Asn)/glutamyl-tRNA(Gln) amidotransferase subunit B